MLAAPIGDERPTIPPRLAVVVIALFVFGCSGASGEAIEAIAPPDAGQAGPLVQIAPDADAHADPPVDTASAEAATPPADPPDAGPAVADPDAGDAVDSAPLPDASNVSAEAAMCEALLQQNAGGNLSLADAGCPYKCTGIVSASEATAISGGNLGGIGPAPVYGYCYVDHAAGGGWQCCGFAWTDAGLEVAQ